MKKLPIIFLICAVTIFFAACGEKATQPKPNPTPTQSTPEPPKDEVPASVKAAFPDAQSVTKQQKEIPDDDIKHIEEELNVKITEKNHTSYTAFKTEGGTRKQIGAATIVKAGDKELLVIYESKKGEPNFKEIRAEGLPAPFLAQFKNKGHDDKLEIGKDLKAEGVDSATANSIASALRLDVAVMTSLYGKGHDH